MEDKRRTAIFVDADGTIIHTKSGNTFPVDKNDWKFDPHVMHQLSQIMSTGGFNFLFVVTNQGGIELGHANHFEMREKFDNIIKAAKEEYGITIQEVLMSPYNSYHYTRKPFPEFAYRMAIKYQLDLQHSVMIGDASGIQEREYVIKFFDGNWQYIKDRSIVPESLHGKIEYDENERTFIPSRKDFSNSDLMFAKNAGMKYIDVVRFKTLKIVSAYDLSYHSYF